MIWCFLWKHHFSPFRIFYRLEEVNYLSRWWFQLQMFFCWVRDLCGKWSTLTCIFFFRSVGSKYYQTESCANFCIISVSKNTIATQDTNPEAIAEVFSRIDHKFDLMCLGSMGNRLWNLSCFGVFGASTAAISKTMGGNPWKESFPWRPTCCSFPVNAVACVLGHVHTGIAWFWQFESIFY